MKSQGQENNLENACIDIEALLSYIRQYSVLYDKSCKNYRLPLKKKNAWKEIGLELAIDWREAPTRYSSVKANFSKYL